MKTGRIISTLALLALAAFAAPAAPAQSAGGSYQFALADGHAKYVEFDARALSGGGATGRMYFSDDAPAEGQDVDGTGDPVETHNGFYFSAEFDGLLVEGTRAVMSGTVNDSSIRALVGRRVLLTVVDGGDSRTPDRVAWGVYADARKGWTPSDAEREHDPGVGLSWLATDAERRDDPGVRMPGDDSLTARTFPLASYEFAVTARESGDIVVEP
jgi:hypothetical protein